MAFDDSSWLLRLVGFDPARIPADADAQLVWTNAPRSWQVFLLLGAAVGLIYVVAWLYRRELETCPRWCKRLLTGIRAAALLVLLAIFLGPAVAPIQRHTPLPYHRPHARQLAVHEHARSLSRKTAQRSRWRGRPAERSLRCGPSNRPVLSWWTKLLERNNHDVLRQLQQRGKLRVLDFSNQVAEMETRPVRPAAPRPSTEEGTAAASAAAVAIKALPSLVAHGRGTDLYGRDHSGDFCQTDVGCCPHDRWTTHRQRPRIGRVARRRRKGGKARCPHSRRRYW